jgi:uncharacterized membrane protein YvbJ
MNSAAIFGSIFRKETAPCPMCQKHISRGEMNCSHCGHELTDLDIGILKQYIRKQQTYGRILGIIIIPAAIILFTWFFMLFE